jgi:hypothetical protein
MINDILKLIMERLTEKEPNIRYMDEDWGQLDYYNDNPPVRWPALLLELQGANWLNQSQKVQDAPLMIALTVADIKTANTSWKAPATQKASAAAIWIVLENIHKALHGWKPAHRQFGALSRVSTRRVKRDDGIRQFEVIYSCLCIDDSAMREVYNIADPVIAEEMFDTVPPEAEINVELLK